MNGRLRGVPNHNPPGELAAFCLSLLYLICYGPPFCLDLLSPVATRLLFKGIEKVAAFRISISELCCVHGCVDLEARGISGDLPFSAMALERLETSISMRATEVFRRGGRRGDRPSVTFVGHFFTVKSVTPHLQYVCKLWRRSAHLLAAFTP